MAIARTPHSPVRFRSLSAHAVFSLAPGLVEINFNPFKAQSDSVEEQKSTAVQPLQLPTFVQTGNGNFRPANQGQLIYTYVPQPPNSKV